MSIFCQATGFHFVTPPFQQRRGHFAGFSPSFFYRIPATATEGPLPFPDTLPDSSWLLWRFNSGGAVSADFRRICSTGFRRQQQKGHCRFLIHFRTHPCFSGTSTAKGSSQRISTKFVLLDFGDRSRRTSAFFCYTSGFFLFSLALQQRRGRFSRASPFLAYQISATTGVGPFPFSATLPDTTWFLWRFSSGGAVSADCQQVCPAVFRGQQL